MARFHLGEIYLINGNYEAAKIELIKALNLNNGSNEKIPARFVVRICEKLAIVCEKYGNKSESVQSIEEGIRQIQYGYAQQTADEKDALIRLYCKLSLKYERHEHVKALSYLLYALNIDNNHPLPHGLLGWFYSSEKIPEYFNLEKTKRHWRTYLALKKSDDNKADTDMRLKILHNLSLLE